MINWNYLDQVYGPMNKLINVMFIFFMVLINFASQLNNSRINVWGHLGGLLIGFFVVFLLKKPEQENDGICCPHKYWVIVSSCILGAFLVGGFLAFYLVPKFAAN
jgi:hypothetical protein